VRPALLVCALAAAGCYPEHPFNCLGNDTRCSPGERCFVDKCAAPDDTCPGGYRFTASTGDSAGTCLQTPPDGGVPCTHEGDPCDDGDPCTLDDKCAGAVCKGTPKMCSGTSCAGGVLTTDTCVAGMCVPKTSMCAPYGCSGNQCGKSCATGNDCAGGYYCASGKCLSCGDYLTDPNFFPVFGPSTPIPGVNQSMAADLSPMLSSDGLTIYFASGRGGMGLDLYSAKRTVADQTTAFASPMPLGAINGPSDDTDPFTTDGKTFLFSSDRAAKGNFDLFTSTLSNGVFSAPIALPGGDMNGPLASPGRDGHPTVTADGKRLYFASDRASPTPGDPVSAIYGAARGNATDPFGSAQPTTGLDPLGSWISPSVTPAGGALFLVNDAVPGHAEAAVTHLDGNGAPKGAINLIRGPDLAGGGNLSITADGCGLVYSNTTADTAGDLAWSFRSGLVSCATAACGAGDGCCPAGCADLVDADCPFPRTVELREFANMTGKHVYLLDGETPPAGYTATGQVPLRAFRDMLPNSVPLSRWISSVACDAFGATYLLGTEAMPPAGFKLDRVVGYAYTNIMGTRGLSRVWRILREVGPYCDEQVTFDQTACAKMNNVMGYVCDSMIGFAVSP
jgi:hypothetical protein